MATRHVRRHARRARRARQAVEGTGAAAQLERRGANPHGLLGWGLRACPGPDWAHPRPHPKRGWAHPCHIRAGTGPAPATSDTGLGSAALSPSTSASTPPGGAPEGCCKRGVDRHGRRRRRRRYRAARGWMYAENVLEIVSARSLRVLRVLRVLTVLRVLRVLRVLTVLTVLRVHRTRRMCVGGRGDGRLSRPCCAIVDTARGAQSRCRCGQG